MRKIDSSDGLSYNHNTITFGSLNLNLDK